MAVNTNEIKRLVQLLANSDPQTYERLIRLCDQYTYELMEGLTAVPQDEILVAQGRAQQARKFMQLLIEKPTA